MNDISAGDSSPKLSKSSLMDSATALNLWYKFVEFTNDFTTPLQFNKATLTIGNVVSKNIAGDYRGFEIQDTLGAKVAGFRCPQAVNLVYLETTTGFPLYINASGSTSRISLRVADGEIAQINATGLGVGMAAAEKLSIGSASNNTNNALAIYAQTSAGIQSFSSVTQEAATGSTNFRYGGGTGGTVKSLVFTGSEGELVRSEGIWQVDNSKIVPLLVKAQQETMETLESTTNALKRALELIALLADEVDSLKKKLA